MESEYFLTDKNGQRIDNLQKYYDENPEILKKHIQRLNENNNWEPSESLFNPEKVKLLIEIHDVGVFRKACEKFYLDWLNEINTRSANENFLLEQKEKAQDFIDESKIEIAYRPDNVVIMENGNYLIATMESLQNKTNRFLSRLEREKAQSNTNGVNTKKSGENRVLAFNNIEDTLFEIEKILEPMNEFLFESSDIKQWKKLLKGEKLTEPIILKKGITHGDIKYFLDEVQRKGIWRAIYATIEDIKAFWYGGRILTAKQISGAKTSEKINDEIIKIPPKHQKQIDEIVKLLD